MKQQHLRNLKTAVRAVKVLGVAACFVTPAAAQQGRSSPNNGQNNGGVIPLPKGVRNVISIDAHNTLLAEVEDASGQNSEYVQIPVRHVYSGGIAKILGGTVVSTEQFVSPAFNKQGGFGNRGNGGNNGGNNGFQGAQQGFNGGNNFNGNNFGNGFGNGYGIGNTTVTGPNGETGTLPNFGGFVGNGQVVPQNFTPQSTLNGRQANRQQARISVNTGNRQLNQILGLIDRPLPQVEVGTSAGSANTSSAR